SIGLGSGVRQSTRRGCLALLARPRAPAHNARMSFLSLPRAARAPARRKRGRRNADAVLGALRRWRKRARQLWRKLNAAPRALRVAVIAATALALFSAANVAYQ